MSLFQKSVEKKYLNNLDSALINKKYADFQNYFDNPERQENIRNSKEEQFQEGFLRELFVNIFEYTLNPEPNFNLTTELKNISNSKKADGAILRQAQEHEHTPDAIAVIELKSTNTRDLDSIETQAFGYKNHHPNCIYVITSNFEKLRFYIQNAVDYIDFDLFKLTKDQFALMWLCLAKDNLLNDLPLKIKDSSVIQEENITKKLYADYSKFRIAIYGNIIKNNPETDKLVLFKKTQKLLDRFLFIFFAEDRLLLPPNSIIEIVKQWKTLRDELDEYVPLYARFKKYFGYMNTGFKGKKYDIYAYNGGLFKSDEILDNILIDDEILHEHTLKLSNYDFETDVDVNILGHIFEHSLGEIENVQAEIKGDKIDSQKTKRKKDGIFYTPKYITKYIVENTIGKLCDEKRIELQVIDEDFAKGRKNRKKDTIKLLIKRLDDYRSWLLTLTILDPACGSGAFLNQALEFLITEHKKIDELRTQILGGGLVFSDITTDILEKNIYGVDLNEESVEIAKLSLWLRTAQKGRKLNTLSNNIKCGNSLIDDPEVAGEKAFNWQNEFPNIFKKKDKKAWHVTTATHNSRYSQRMFDNYVKLGVPVWLSEKEEIIVTETIAAIVEKDNLNIVEYNICGDHAHILLVCEEEELTRIVQKIKSMSARACNIAMGRTIPKAAHGEHAPQTGTDISAATSEHAPMSAEINTGDTGEHAPHKNRGETQHHLWTQKFGQNEITSNEQFDNTISYIKNNRQKHQLPENKELQTLIDRICCSRQHAFRPEYNGGFDVVIGNPPYGAKLDNDSKDYLGNKYISFNKNYDVYSAFMQLAFRLIKDEGFWGYINPVSWQSNENYFDLRNYLKENGKLEVAIKLPYDVFTDAYVDTGIYIIKKQQSNSYISLVYDFPVRASISVTTLQFVVLHELPSIYWTELESLKIVLNPHFYELLPKLFNNSTALKELTESARGILPNKEDVTEVKQNNSKPYFIGNLYRYDLRMNYSWVNYGDNLKEKPKKYGWFTGERILVRRLINRQFRVMGSITFDEFVNKKDIYVIKLNSEKISSYFLLTIINSSLVSFLKTKGSTNATKDDFSQLTLNDLREIPIKLASDDLQMAFTEKVKPLMSRKDELQKKKSKFINRLIANLKIAKISNKLDAFYNFDFKIFLSELKKQKVILSLTEQDEWEEYFNAYKSEINQIQYEIGKADKEIDQMVYELYGLTDEEIKIVEGV